MPALNFENVISSVVGNFNVSGEVHLHEGQSTQDLPAVFNTPPVNTIQTDQALYVHFRWKQIGWLSCMLNGSWQLNVFFELMGAGETPANPASVVVPFTPVDGQKYSAFITMPPNSMKPGVYRVVGRLMLNSPSGQKTPLAAFADIGMIQVYDD